MKFRSAIKFNAGRRAFSLANCLGLGIGLAALAPGQNLLADTNWTGAVSQDWNTPGNWDNGVPDTAANNGAARVNISTGNYPIFTAGPQAAFDIFVASGANTTGRLDQSSGTLATGNSNWMFVGQDGGVGTYNLSGTGNLNAGALNVGAWSAPGSTGTATINTSGTITLTAGARGGGVGDASLLVGENGNTGNFNLQSGTVNANLSAKFGLGSNGTPSAGNLTMSGGTMNVTGETWMGNDNGTSTATQTGGTFNSTSYFVVARLGATTTYNLSAGTINGATTNGGSEVGSAAGSNGTMNVSGTGVFNSAQGGLIVGNGWTGTGTATGTLNVSNSGQVNVGTQNLTLGVATGNVVGNGTVNLNGGTIQAGSVNTVGAGNTSTFNFNGGLLQATQSSATFMSGLTSANVLAGGAKINSNGFNVTVGQALLHGGAAATDGGLTKSGAGTLTLSAVNTYTGATLVSAGELTLAATGSINASNDVQVSAVGTLTLQGTATLSDTGTVSLLSGATFNLSAASGTEVIGTLFLNGAAVPVGTYTAADLNARNSGVTFTTGGETLQVTSVPEPSTWAMGLMGGAALLGMARRRRVQAWLRLSRAG